MNDESTGLNERRARTIVVCVLIAETVWVFLQKYLPLDAGLWALQAELVRHHLAGHAHDSWHLIPYPASNIGAPIFAALLTSLFSGEVAVRLMLTAGAIFLRGMGMLSLFRVLRVRDAAIYFLIPVLAMTGLWFTGALPYLMAETLALWVLVYFLSQDHPRSSAYWILSIGLLLISLLSGLVFLFMIVAVITIMLEQRRNVHLSQGWLNEPRSVLSLLTLGVIVLALGLLAGEPILRLSSSGFIPTGLSRDAIASHARSQSTRSDISIWRYSSFACNAVVFARAARVFCAGLSACYRRSDLAIPRGTQRGICPAVACAFGTASGRDGH